MASSVAFRFGPWVLAAWLVPALLVAPRAAERWTRSSGLIWEAAWLAGVLAIGVAIWVGSSWGLARARSSSLEWALPRMAPTYVWLLLALPAFVGALPAGLALSLGAVGCLIAKGAAWMRPGQPLGVRHLYLALGLLALLFALPSVFVSRNLASSAHKSLSNRDESYEDKMTEKWPELYPLMRFVAANTPTDATIELPPHVVSATESPMGNPALGYYFLRPRTIVQAPPPLDQSAFPAAYTVVAYGQFESSGKARAVWPRLSPPNRLFEPMPQQLTTLLNQLVGTGPGGEFFRLDFERRSEPVLRRLASSSQSALIEHRVVDQGHAVRRSESIMARYETGSFDEWAFDLDEVVTPGQSLTALVRTSQEGTVRLFADFRMPDGRATRLYSEPNSLERWWDNLSIHGLGERATAAGSGMLGVGESPRLTAVGLQVTPHFERWGLIVPAGSG